ncbi:MULTISPECIES: CpXC domain-containing protein [Facklamia]|uniref:CpXC domain-containing protein n=1 Tax=Facklamia TaxID=66831 RepID=UPI0008A42795|nr:CpXC domain-containing protein [Facklamia sp. HMSC062C11]OFL67407.1 hypothetical protein HMPREF2758_06105 [Facklamia sp. HMSC062C11]
MQDRVSFVCPICQQATERPNYAILNAQKQRDLKLDLLAGDLFRFECPHCGGLRLIETPFLYYDPKLKFAIYLDPHFDHHPQESIEQAQLSLIAADEDSSRYHLRLVNRLASLVEKVHIFDQGFNDQLVEVVKLLTDGLFAQQEGDRQVSQRYFQWDKGKSQLLYLTDQGTFKVDYLPKLVQFIQKKYAKELKQTYLGEWLMVDHHWALRIAQHESGLENDETLKFD